MSLELVLATAAISMALVFYTVGVFSERRAGSLSLRHVVVFWMGLACDTTGTLIMTSIANQGAVMQGASIHGVSGTLAIVLMLAHATWATVTYIRRDEAMQVSFHTFSTFVWLVWLVPYIIGMLVGIPAIHLQAVCAVGTAIVAVAAIVAALFVSSRLRAAHRK